ncbi:MAG: hypothetical protein R3C59_04440 [Planctomycetaceae bacterium]
MTALTEFESINHTDRRRPDVLNSPRVAAFIAAVVGVLLFSESLRFGYVYDDVPIVVRDKRLQDPWFFLSAWWEPWWNTTSSLGESRPITALTFWLQRQLHGEAPMLPHLVNVLLFGVLTFLVARTSAAWLRRDWVAWPVGLVFASHPIHVEAVVNLVGRAETLSAIFAVCAIRSWLKWRDRMCWKRSFVVAVMVLLAGQSKETGYLSAAVILLAEIGERRCRNEVMFCWRWLLPLGTWFSLVAACAVTQRMVVWSRMRSVYHLSTDFIDPTMNPLIASDLTERFVTGFQLIGKAAQLFVFPVNQSHDYSPRLLMPSSNWFAPLTLLGIGVAALWAVCVYRAWRNRSRSSGPLLACCIAWLVPSNMFVLIGVIFAERLLMMLSIFLLIAAIEVVAEAWGEGEKYRGRLNALAFVTVVGVLFYIPVMLYFVDLVAAISFDVHFRDRTIAWIAISAIGVLAAVRITRRALLSLAPGLTVFAFGLTTLCYSPLWQSTNTLVMTAAVRHPENGRLQGLLSTTLVAIAVDTQQNLYGAAEEAANRAIEIWPQQPNPYIALACIAQRNGDENRVRLMLDRFYEGGWDPHEFETMLNHFGIRLDVEGGRSQ